MTVLFLIPSMGGGGAERQVTYLAAALVRRGHRVHVALLYDGPNSERLAQSGAAVHRIRRAGALNPLLVFRVVEIVRSVRPDLVHTFLPMMDVIGGIAARLCGVPWVATERSRAEAYPRSLRALARMVAMRRADAIVANSNGGIDYWNSRAKAPLKVAIPNAYPVRGADSASPVLNRDRARIVFVGRLSAEKNIATIIAALSREPLRNATLVLCGDGPLRTSLAELARERGVSDRVVFRGFVGNVDAEIRSAGVFVSPSFFEGQPNTVIEAMACGCPVVVSDQPAHRELLDDAAAIFFDAASADAAAEALSRALRDYDASERRAAAALERLAVFDPDRVAILYEQLYDRVLKNR